MYSRCTGYIPNDIPINIPSTIVDGYISTYIPFFIHIITSYYQFIPHIINHNFQILPRKTLKFYIPLHNYKFFYIPLTPDSDVSVLFPMIFPFISD